MQLKDANTEQSRTEWPVIVPVISGTVHLRGLWQGGGGTNWFQLRVTVQFEMTAQIIPPLFTEDYAHTQWRECN